MGMTYDVLALFFVELGAMGMTYDAIACSCTFSKYPHSS